MSECPLPTLALSRVIAQMKIEEEFGAAWGETVDEGTGPLGVVNAP